MGHRKNRKRERRQRQDFARWDNRPAVTEDQFIESDVSLLLEMSRQRIEPPKQCGGCREFVEDQEGGRGTCLHPGSGILSPWMDTPACDFFARGRAMRR